MRGRSLVVAGLALAAVLALASACDDGDTAEPTATPAATSEPTATAPATATPTAPTGRTGIPELDAVIDALRSGDPAAIELLLRFNSVPCTTAFGLGGPPKCGPGESDGDLVDVFLNFGCEGGYAAPEDAGRLAEGFASKPLYAVYRVPDDYGFTNESYADLGFPTEYTAIVSDEERTAATELLIHEGGIIGTRFSCVAPPEEFVKALGLEDAVLPPPTDRTGIPELDAVIDFLRLGDSKAMQQAARQLVGFTEVACTTTPQGIGSPPECQLNEEDGELVDVFPVSTCEFQYVRPHEINSVLSLLADSTLYAVYPATLEVRFPGEHVVVLVRSLEEMDVATEVVSDEGRIVGVNFTCALTPEALVEQHQLEDALLPPQTP